MSRKLDWNKVNTFEELKAVVGMSLYNDMSLLPWKTGNSAIHVKNLGPFSNLKKDLEHVFVDE